MRDAPSSRSASDATRTAASSRSASWREVLTDLWPYALICLVGIVVLGAGLGDTGFWDPREPKYAQGAREMLERGSCFVATYRGEALPAGPLPFWSVIAGWLVFGREEFGARFGGVCIALAAMLGVYYAVSRLRGRRAAILSAIVLGTMPQFSLLARQATPDIFVLTGLGMGLIFFGLGRFGPERRRSLHFALSAGCLAVAVLAKGLQLAGGIFLSVLLVFEAVRFDAARLKKLASSVESRRRVGRRVLLFLAVLLVIAAPWVVTLVSRGWGGTAEAATILLDEEESGKAFYFYFRPIVYGFFPWIFFLPLAVTTLVRWRVRDPLGRFGFEGFLLIASAVTFTFISIPAGKWPSYVAPLLVPVAVLVGLVLDRLLRNPDPVESRFSWAVVAVLYAPAMLDLLRGDGVEYILESVTTHGEVPETMLPVRPFAVLLVAIGLAILASMVVRSAKAVGALALVTACFTTYYGGVFVPALDPLKSMKTLCDTWRQHRPEGRRVGFNGEAEGGAYFYCDAMVEPVHALSFLKFMDPGTPAYCIVSRDALPELSGFFRTQYPGKELHVFDDGHEDYVLVANRPPGAS
jgi:4-amino-4-deoxy-L-arabinose transferase-like glycosyltransferase